MLLDTRLQHEPERLPVDLLPPNSEPARRSRVAALMLEIASAIRGFNPAWLCAQFQSDDYAIDHGDQIHLLRNLYRDMVERRQPIAWEQFQPFGFSAAALDLRAESDRVPLGHEFPDLGRLDVRIASGGVAVVYRATSTVDGRPLAVKIAKRHPNDEHDQHAERLVAEAVLLRRLRLPGIPQLVEFRQESFGPLLVLEWIETQGGHGIPAAAPLRERLKWIADIARTLDQVHQRDLIHGDVKMENILVDQNGIVWLTDFNVTRDADPRHQQEGRIAGTISMMSQEALVGVAVDADISQDIYGLGAVLYQTITGRRLVNQGIREAALVASVLIGGVHDPEYPDGTAEALKKIVKVAISRHVHQRFATAGDFAATIEQYLDGTLTESNIPPLRRELQAWYAGSRLGLCITRNRRLRDLPTADAVAGATTEEWRTLRTNIAEGMTAALAAEEFEQCVTALDWPIPPCPCIKEMMTYFYRHARLTAGDLSPVRAVIESFESWLRSTCQELEATIAHQDPRNYLLLVTAMQARLVRGSETARMNWSNIAAMAGLPDATSEAFRKVLDANPSSGEEWSNAVQELDFAVVRWLRWATDVSAVDNERG